MTQIVLRADSTLGNSYRTMPESDVTAATIADGWTVAKVSSANDSEYLVGTKRASTTFTTEAGTPKPGTLATGASANAFRSLNAYTTTFQAAAWTLTFAVRATTASSQAGRVRCRVFASSNADGTSSRELTASTQVGSTSSALSTSADVTSVVTWTPASPITLANEYLFFVVAWEITTASGSNSGDVQFRTGQSAGGTRIASSHYLYTKSGAGVEGSVGAGTDYVPTHLAPRILVPWTHYIRAAW